MSGKVDLLLNAVRVRCSMSACGRVLVRHALHLKQQKHMAKTSKKQKGEGGVG